MAFCRKLEQLSGMTAILLVAYLAQMVAVFITEKDITVTIPLWFMDRCRNVMQMQQYLGNLYQRFYQTMTTTMQPQLAVAILVIISAVMASVLCFVIRMAVRCLLRKWKNGGNIMSTEAWNILKSL